MDDWIRLLMADLSLVVLLGLLALFLAILAKGADLLVREAVTLSVRWGVPTVVIGATVVSLGTTLPEMAVSVMSAVRGNPGLALGNAVGSIIVDTGLILGLVTIIRPLPIVREVVNRQAWIKIGTGLLLVVACFPWYRPSTVFRIGGVLEQWMGWVFLLLLIVYLYGSVQWSRKNAGVAIPLEKVELPSGRYSGGGWILLRLCVGILLVTGASQLVIPVVEETAMRLRVPDAIIAATLVAFGTSLPELVTAIVAVRRNQGGLALGNIIGADILNVLFVAGAAAAVSPSGLAATPYFFTFLFPTMVLLLLVFLLGLLTSGDRLGRPFGFTLLSIYVLATTLSFTMGVGRF